MRNDGSIELAIARHFIGIAREGGARTLSDAGIVPPAGVWGDRWRVLSVQDRAYQINVSQHIMAMPATAEFCGRFGTRGNAHPRRRRDRRAFTSGVESHRARRV